MGKLLFAVMFAYPVWLGATGRGVQSAAIFAIVLAIALFFFGPRQDEVQGNPSKPAMALFSAVLAAGGTAIAYGIGSLFA